METMKAIRGRQSIRAYLPRPLSREVIVQVLEGENAIAKNRELMGATNPKEAAAGTIRADHAQTVDENAVHGSDGPDTAAVEIAFFFPTAALA